MNDIINVVWRDPIDYTNEMIAKALKSMPDKSDGKRITFQEIFDKIDKG